MLGLQVRAPLHRVLEFYAGFLQDIHGFGVADPTEVVVHHVVEPIEKPLVDELVEELHLVGAAVHDGADDVLHHGLGHLHVALQVAEGHLRLDHPELRRVPGGEAVLRPKGGAEGVDVPEGHGEGLAVELAGAGEVHGLFEEVLGVVHLPVLGTGEFFEVQGGHLEHLAPALAVGVGQDGGVDVDEAPILEELVDGRADHGPDPKDRLEGVGPGPQGLLGAEVLKGVPLLLHGVVRGALAQDGDLVRLHLEGLGRVGGHNELPVHGDGAACGQALPQVPPVVLEDHLDGFEAGAVVELDKAHGLALPHGADPAAHGDLAHVGLGRALYITEFQHSVVLLFHKIFSLVYHEFFSVQW